jgi:hypothetical protein
MIKSISREYVGFGMGVLGVVVFGAVVLAIQEHPRPINPKGKAVRAGSPVAEISPQKNRFSQIRPPASTPAPILALTPEINDQKVSANVAAGIPANRPDSGRVIGLKIPHARSRSSVRPRIVDVKRRLITLWHQSLARSEKSRGWTLYPNSSKAARKKVSYTAETNH